MARRAAGTIIPTAAPSSARAAMNCHSSVATANHSRPIEAIATPDRSSSRP